MNDSVIEAEQDEFFYRVGDEYFPEPHAVAEHLLKLRYASEVTVESFTDTYDTEMPGDNWLDMYRIFKPFIIGAPSGNEAHS